MNVSIRIEWRSDDRRIVDVGKMALPAKGELYLSKGLRLRISSKGLLVSGGSSSEVPIPLPAAFGRLDLGPILDIVESRFDVRGMGRQTQDAGLSELQPLEGIFRVGSNYISAGMLGEVLLMKMEVLQAACRERLMPNEIAGRFTSAQECCATLRDEVIEGHLDKGAFDLELTKLRAQYPLLSVAFFISNINDRADTVRAALLRASYHLARMTFALDVINQSLSIVPRRSKPPYLKRERRQFSPSGDIVADEFANGVLACYSSLDLLRKLFDYGTREPFGEPSKPPDLLFDAPLPSNLPSYALPRPFAVPNIAASHFKALYILRSDLFHNSAADYLRAAIYVGFGLPPVNSEPVQYAQYMTRDLSPSAAGLSHRWASRFYAQRRDAQHALSEWINDAWQTAFDTTDWLIHHTREMTPLIGR